jgi:hypothetical protein
MSQTVIIIGKMAEWLNAPVLKTGNCNRFWGSNPCLSAKQIKRIVTARMISSTMLLYPVWCRGSITVSKTVDISSILITGAIAL